MNTKKRIIARLGTRSQLANAVRPYELGKRYESGLAALLIVQQMLPISCNDIADCGFFRPVRCSVN